MSHTIHVTDTTFQSEVIESPLPVLVDFYGDHCPPCQKLAPVLDELADEVRGRAKIVKVNADESPDLFIQYQVNGVPSLIVFRDGQITHRTLGFRSKDALIKALEL